MSRILRRPMFRGGKVSSYGTGIASGLADGGMPKKRGLVDGPGGYSGVLEMYRRAEEQIPAYEPQGLTTGDYLRIASAGLDILGQPGQQGGISGALAAASKPLAQLGVDLGTSIDAREAKGRERRDDLVKAVTAGEVDLETSRIRSRTAIDAKKGYLDAVYDLKRQQAGGDKAKLAEIEKDYQRDFELFVVKGFDASDIFNVIKGDAVQERIFEIAESAVEAKGISEDDPRYSTEVFKEAQRVANEYATSLQTSFADGGAVDVTETVTEEVIQEPTKPMPMQVTYDQLRARLPKEIGDEIVNLLANSYEALADFAAIATQADVDNFNTKYGVELVLPQEA